MIRVWGVTECCSIRSTSRVAISCRPLAFECWSLLAEGEGWQIFCFVLRFTKPSYFRDYYYAQPITEQSAKTNLNQPWWIRWNNIRKHQSYRFNTKSTLFKMKFWSQFETKFTVFKLDIFKLKLIDSRLNYPKTFRNSEFRFLWKGMWPWFDSEFGPRYAARSFEVKIELISLFGVKLSNHRD